MFRTICSCRISHYNSDPGKGKNKGSIKSPNVLPREKPLHLVHSDSVERQNYIKYIIVQKCLAYFVARVLEEVLCGDSIVL